MAKNEIQEAAKQVVEAVAEKVMETVVNVAEKVADATTPIITQRFPPARWLRNGRTTKIIRNW